MSELGFTVTTSKSIFWWFVQIMKLSTPMPTDGGSSPMLKTKGDKQVEYLDLDLESSMPTPPRKVSLNLHTLE